MAIGLGIVLLVSGLVLALEVITVHMSYINEGALGGILIAAGILAIVLSLIVNQQRTRRTSVVEERQIVDDRRP